MNVEQHWIVLHDYFDMPWSFYYYMIAEFCATRTQISLLLALTIATLTAILYSSIDGVVDSQLKKSISLNDNGSDYFKGWVKSDAIVNLDVYIFEVINSKDFLTNCSKIRITERGPYSYKVTSGRKVFEQSESLNTISYYDFKNFRYNFERSAGNLTDSIHVVSLLTVALNQYLIAFKDKSVVGRAIKTLFNFYQQQFFESLTVDELLFKGKRSQVLDSLKQAWNLYQTDEPFPEIPLIDNTFGLFYKKNLSYSGPFEVYSDSKRLGCFRSWKNATEMNIWFGDQCNQIKGTDSTLFPPSVEKSSVLHVFVTDFCRSIAFVYEKTIDFKGLQLYRFIMKSNVFDNTHPENECYCNQSDVNCKVEGLIYLEQCLGAPLALSLPHFLRASPKVQSQVEGLAPDEVKYNSYLDIEPLLGLPLRARMGFQLNVLLGKQKLLTDTQEVKCDSIVPMVRIEYSGEATDAEAEMVEQSVIKTIAYVRKGKIFYFFAAVCFIFITTVLAYFKYSKNRLTKLQLPIKQPSKLQENSIKIKEPLSISVKSKQKLVTLTVNLQNSKT